MRRSAPCLIFFLRHGRHVESLLASPSKRSRLQLQARRSTGLRQHSNRRGSSSQSNWTDDSKSSRVDASVTEFLPPWRDHEGANNFSGSQAQPGKGRPFRAFRAFSPAASPQQNVSPGLLDQQQAQSPATPAIAAAAPRGSGVGGGGGMAIHPVKWPLVRDPPGVASEFPLLMTRILVTCLSSVGTWYLSLYNGYSAVLASSALTLLVSTCLDRRLGQAAFCGSFAGMSGGHIAPNLSVALLLSVLASASYEVLIHINNSCLGIGGRLGATAFLATGIFAKYRGVRFIGRKLRRGVWSSSSGVSSVAISMILFHIMGAVATIMLRESSDDSAAADPVRASSVVGVLGSLFINDPTSALALYGGSFVGMSLPSRLMYGNAPGNARPGQPQSAANLLASFAGAGAIAGLVHALTIHSGYWTGGWGGKAGLCAFAGCWVYRGFGNVSRFLKKSSHQTR
mmetsp:Transcript_15883/g.36613  ORF Transcript_15883/g.36613 Transcript_15883/m.36613 type:complete len:455 (+) Transcript_15883:126-1490(+)